MVTITIRKCDQGMRRRVVLAFTQTRLLKYQLFIYESNGEADANENYCRKLEDESAGRRSG